MSKERRPRKILGMLFFVLGLILFGTGIAWLSGVRLDYGILQGDGDEKGEYLDQANEMLGWNGACDALLAADLGLLINAPGEPEVASESSPTTYSASNAAVQCALVYQVDCQTGEPATHGGSWITVAAYPQAGSDIAGAL